MIVWILQTYSKEAVDHVQEALTRAQKTRELPAKVFDVSTVLFLFKESWLDGIALNPRVAGSHPTWGHSAILNIK